MPVSAPAGTGIVGGFKLPAAIANSLPFVLYVILNGLTGAEEIILMIIQIYIPLMWTKNIETQVNSNLLHTWTLAGTPPPSTASVNGALGTTADPKAAGFNAPPQ